MVYVASIIRTKRNAQIWKKWKKKLKETLQKRMNENKM